MDLFIYDKNLRHEKVKDIFGKYEKIQLLLSLIIFAK